MLARSSSRGSDPADVCPHLERTRPGGAVLAGGDVVAAEMEQVADLAVGGEETLCLAGRLEALHLPLSSPCRLVRSEEHTSELQSRQYLVCRLLLEKKKNTRIRDPVLPLLLDS